MLITRQDRLHGRVMPICIDEHCLSNSLPTIALCQPSGWFSTGKGNNRPTTFPRGSCEADPTLLEPAQLPITGRSSTQ